MSDGSATTSAPATDTAPAPAARRRRPGPAWQSQYRGLTWNGPAADAPARRPAALFSPLATGDTDAAQPAPPQATGPAADADRWISHLRMVKLDPSHQLSGLITFIVWHMMLVRARDLGAIGDTEFEQQVRTRRTAWGITSNNWLNRIYGGLQPGLDVDWTKPTLANDLYEAIITHLGLVKVMVWDGKQDVHRGQLRYPTATTSS